MKEKQTVQARFETLTDTQISTLSKIHKQQCLCLGVLFILFLCTVGGVVIAFIRLSHTMALALKTAALVAICGATLCLVLVIAVEIFFKKKYPYYTDKLYLYCKKAK